ncbi:MAG: hypothetical protein MJ072_00025 [Clostridia bacterium]|nr:hypothetical protein [Clostridia bacterium]
MADYGTPAATYTPGVIDYSGRIAKIIKSVIEGVGIPDKYEKLVKPIEEYGKDLEVTLYNKATGQNYSATVEAQANAPEVVGSLLFKTWTKKSYGVLIDDNQIAESALDAGDAKRNADNIIDTLYSGATYDNTIAIDDTLRNAPFKDGGSAPVVPANFTEAQTLTLKIKDLAAKVRNGDPSVNPSNAYTKAKGKVVMFISRGALDALDVYMNATSFNDNYLRFGVDEVFAYEDSEFPQTAEDHRIYILDDTALQFYHKAPHYREREVGGCDNVKAWLHTRNLYAFCKLFNAARIEL